MTTYDVVKKLVGPIYPVGDSDEDELRLKNLELMTILVNLLVRDIDEVSYRNKTRKEDSIQKAVKFADNFLHNELGID